MIARQPNQISLGIKNIYNNKVVHNQSHSKKSIIIIYNMSQYSRVRDKISSQFFYHKIKDQQFEDIILSDEKVVKQFTQFIESIPLQIDSLVIIKLLAKSYGLPVIIYFKNFYEKAEQSKQFIKNEIAFFSKISSIAKWASNKQQIQSINFIHQAASSVKAKQYKGLQMQQIDLEFIQFIRRLELKSKQLKNKVKEGMQRRQVQKYYQQYYKWINQDKKRRNFDQLMLQSISKFMISLESLIMILAPNSNQNKEEIKNSIEQNMQKIKTSQFKNQEQQKYSHEVSNDQIQVDSFSQSSGSSFLNESLDFYKVTQSKNIKSLFQSSICQMQKNIKIQFQNNSYASFVEGMSPNSTSSKNKSSQQNNIEKNYSFKKQKDKNQKYCQSSPNPKKEIAIVQKATKSENRVDQNNGEKRLRSRDICCRSYFYYQQKINQMQNETITYMNAPFPFKKQKNQQIKRVICSFLNHSGGNLYIGIVSENNEYIVVGNVFCEGEKQAILKSFRQICQTIEPDILTHKMYNVQFVPLKQKYTVLMHNMQQQRQRYILGNYVLKITVRYGIRDQIYSYKSGYGYGDCFPFRCQHQIIHKQGRQLLKQLDLRIKHPLPIPEPLHPYPCQKPQIGQVLNKTYIQFQYSQKSSNVNLGVHSNLLQKQAKQKQKISYQSHHKNQSPIKQNKKMNTPPKKGITVHFQADILKTPESTNQKTINKLNSNKAEVNSKGKIEFQSPVQKNEVKIKQLQQSCFYVKGLTKRQVTPVLQKKSMLDKVKMEQSQYEQTLGFVIKTFDSETKQKLCKILQKIRQKYDQLQISYDEITLQMQVVDMKQVISKLREIKIQYKVISQNSIKFTYYKDSLKAFIYLRKRDFLIRYA